MPSAIATRPRVLHLIHPEPPVSSAWFAPRASWRDGPAAAALCRDAIGFAPEMSHDVLVFGARAGLARCRRLGIRVRARVSMPMSLTWSASRPVGEWIEAFGEPDVIHAWGGNWEGVVRRLPRRRAACVLTDVSTGEVRFWDRGQTRETVRELEWKHARCPASERVKAESSRAAGADALRTHERRRCCVLLGESAEDADAVRFAGALGIVGRAGVEVEGVMSMYARGVRRALRHRDETRQVPGLRVTQEPIERIARQADVCVVALPARVRASWGLHAEVCRVSAMGVRVVAPDEPGWEASAGAEERVRMPMSDGSAAIARGLMRALEEHRADEPRAARGHAGAVELGAPIAALWREVIGRRDEATS